MSKNYVRFSWMAELKLTRFNKRTDGKLEASIICCTFSWNPHLTNERFKKTALRILEETSKDWEQNILDLLHFSVKIPINKVVMVSYEKKAVKVLVSDFCKLTIFKSDSKWSPDVQLLINCERIQRIRDAQRSKNLQIFWCWAGVCTAQCQKHENMELLECCLTFKIDHQ